MKGGIVGKKRINMSSREIKDNNGAIMIKTHYRHIKTPQCLYMKSYKIGVP